ncbi:nucleotide exchange factor GrpE [Metallibacterium sp.]|jgi:molecular chaperone GrpE|uniref:nucleotide exchange factor GrpE n=1 Tax=Metallibacterium sp. TaxID=2940281 RepID=UPI002605D344|nr:nucleotide exchange factor GrpE [Metallibacterium sp.]
MTTPETSPPESTPDSIDADLAALSERLVSAEDAASAAREMMLREHAEIENQRKRLQRDLEQARKFANERVLGDLLAVADALGRGLAVANADAASLRAGMELTLKELERVMQAHGLSAIEPVGQPFDAERHQAMSLVDAPGQAPNTVVAVLQKGYLLNERLLRPALVTVARAAGA